MKLRSVATLAVSRAIVFILAAAPAAQDLSAVTTPQRPSGEQVPAGLSTSEWTSIRSAYDACRYATSAVDGGHRARNPGQQWTTLFDGLGFLTTPDDGDWSWGLELVGYGRAGHERAVTTPHSVAAEGQRVAYAWDERLTEWYVNDQRGLEHGYTLHRPPEMGDGALELALSIRGGLDAVVAADGRSVSFVAKEGGVALVYSGLCVVDADGKALSACFTREPGGLRLTVHDQLARYPVMIDPIAQQAYLKASNTGAIDQFGVALAVSGDTVVIGAGLEDSNATGVNGDQSNNGASGAGAAYVFVRNGASWSQQAYLKASNTGFQDGFGNSVAISGDTLVVGAPSEDSNATGVNGDQANDGAGGAGAAYVFVRSGATWSQQAYLKASNTGPGDNFGNALAVSGDTVVVGARDEDSAATGVNGNQGDLIPGDFGAAYVFVRSGTSWSQQAYLKASNSGFGDGFGTSVAVSSDTVVVGAQDEDSAATGVNGDQSNNSALDSGAVYVFVRSGTSWSQQAYLKAFNTASTGYFGFALGVSGDTVVAGSVGDDSSATGVNGDQGDTGATDSGAAYVFVRSGLNWSGQAYLKASNTEAGDWFGFEVKLSGDTVVVGAVDEDSRAWGVNGGQRDNNAEGSGAAYVFVRSGLVWSQLAYLKASNTGTGDSFGVAASVSGDTVVVGAWGESSAATGVNGDQADDGAFASGAAYVFDLDLDAWTDLGSGLSGVSGLPSLVGTGTLLAGSPGTLALSDAAPSAFSILFVSLVGTPAPFKCGALVPVPVLLQFWVFTNGSGALPLGWASWTGFAGQSLYFQYAIQDATAVCGVALSNALRADVP